jgi:hypothetical protein
MPFPVGISGSQNSTPGTWSRYLSAAADEWLTLNPRHRFRQVPTFGNGVIRKFANNTSEMKKLAARDFEDILQVFLLSSICLHQVC